MVPVLSLDTADYGVLQRAAFVPPPREMLEAYGHPTGVFESTRLPSESWTTAMAWELQDATENPDKARASLILDDLLMKIEAGEQQPRPYSPVAQ